MQFLYFIPNIVHASGAVLAALGLDARLGTVAQGPVDKGPAPSGGAGGCLAASGQGDPPAMHAADERLRWVPVFARPSGAGSAVASPSSPAVASPSSPAVASPSSPDASAANAAPAYYLGWRPDEPPTADELARPRPIPGRTVTLGDGGEWLTPVARSVDGRFGVDVTYGLDADGREAMTPVARHRRLWELASEAATAYLDPDRGLGHAEALELAIEALAANYRLGRPEILALGLLASDTVLEIVRIVTGIADALDGDAKKNSTPGSGPPD